MCKCGLDVRVVSCTSSFVRPDGGSGSDDEDFKLSWVLRCV